jgi:CHASE1-domain containing sensor protein
MRARGYLAFFVGICLTAWTCYFVMEEQQKQQVRAGFQRDVEKVTRDTQTRLQIYFDTLHAMKGVYAVNERIDRLQFQRFATELDVARRYPGFQALQFVRAVPEAELPALVERVRGDTSVTPQGYPNFHLHPATLRPQHYIIEYTEPLKGNENAFGLDLAALPPHLKSIELARDSGAVVATERITLVQDATGEPGFVARLPVYRNGQPLDTTAQRREALVGLVAIVFRMNVLMREVIDAALLEHLHVRVEDGGFQDSMPPGPDVDTLLYDSDGRVETHQPRAETVPGLTSETVMAVGHRNWIIKFEGRAGTRDGRSRLPVVLIGLAGITISALIALLMVANRRESLTRQGLEGSLRELEIQKNTVEQARNDLARVVATLKQAQTNLQTSEKMASLGALVAGVAHELNTPIGNSLLTATSLFDMVRDFERQLKEGPGVKRSTLEAHMADARKACEIMANSLTRAADLITSFKQVAVDQASGQRRLFRLDEVLHDTLAT